MSKQIPFSFDELVFDHRNKEYGAYVLRRASDRNALAGLLLATALASAFILIPYLFGSPKDLSELLPEKPPIPLTNPFMEPVPPPPTKKMPQPPNSGGTIRHLAMVVSISEMDSITTIEELKDLNPGRTTQNGDGFSDLPGNDDWGRDVIGDGDGDNTKPLKFAEKMPQFPGGDDSLMIYLAKNTRYPQPAKELGTQGTVYVSFVVDQYGRITDVELIRGIGAGCDEEAMRVISGMPRWSPGRQGGRPVKVQYRLPIRFVLQ